MPGFLLLEDAQKAATERLQDFGQGLLHVGAPSAPNPTIDANDIVQRLQQHAQDAFQSVQSVQFPDPNEITQRLQQHGMNVLGQGLQAADQNVQAIGEGVQNVIQPQVQAAQQTLHNVQQGVQDLSQGAQQAVQPVAQAVVDRGGDLHAYARQAAQRAGIDPDIFERQIQQESGFSATAKSPAGATGIAQFMPGTAAGMGVDPSDPYASLDGAAQLMANHLKQYGGDYAKALAAYNAGPGNVDKYGGVPPFEETQRYVKTILGEAKQAVGNVVGGARQAVQNILPGVSQFGDKQLSNAEAYAACGPAAAVRFAQLTGRNPTLREATDLAATVGWTAGQGMAGLQSESKLFDLMQVPHRVLGADWQAFAREAQSGNPVTLSTPGHYFTADAFDPASGAFHVGQSGLDLRGGSEWMTPAQMEQRMGSLQGGLVADNPQTPSGSPLSAPPSGGAQGPRGLLDQAGQLVQQGGRAIGEGLQSLDRTIKNFGGNLIADTSGPQTASQQPTPSDVLTNPLGTGNALEQPTSALIGQPAGGTSPREGPSVLPSLDQVQEALRRGDLQGAQDALGQAREAVATSAAGPFLGALRGPALLSDQEVLATPQAQIARNFLRAAGGPEPTDQEVVEGARGLLTGQAVAGAHSTPGATRMYHGTGSTFDRVNPGRLSEDSLFGPGYYLTSDPRVAGGTVRGVDVTPQPGDIESAWGNVLNPATNPELRRGAVISRGYAQEMAPPPESLDALTERRDMIRQALQDPNYGSASGRKALEDLLTRAQTDIQNFAGPNVRPVDVPQDLKLFDMDRPLTKDESTRVADALGYEPSDPEVQAWSTPDVDGKSVYDLILGETGGNKGEANLILSRAGFDGIQHTGGHIMPMLDEAGRTIEHDVKIIFPESIDKVRNALSGTQGGRIRTDFAAGLGGAAAIGAGALSLGGFKAPDLGDLGQRAQDALGQAKDTLANTGLGQAITEPGGLGERLAKGTALLSDEDVLRSREATTARDILERTRQAQLDKGQQADPVTEQEVIDTARTLMGSQVAGSIDQGVLRSLRAAGLVAGPGRAATIRGPIAQGVDVTKQMILSNPATHIANVIGNTTELVRQPVALTLGGRPRDALSSVIAVGRALPEASKNALSALGGSQLATLSGEASSIPARSPIFRGLSAADAFTRTLGEYQGMAAEATHLLSQAGIKASDPAAAGFLASRAADLYRAGARSGAQSVFGQAGSVASGRNALEQIFTHFSTYKEDLLSSPRLRDQALGGLLDFFVPFSGVPVRMLEIAANRLPASAQAMGGVRVARALRAGNVAEAKRAFGDTALETIIQAAIIKNIADGNITGSDDPDHPNSVRIGGNWVSMNEFGGYSLPMQMMASFAEGFEKGGHDVPPGTPGASPLEQYSNYYGPRFAAAVNASMKPFQKAIPGADMLKLVTAIGQGGTTSGLLSLGQDFTNRVASPGAARFLENLSDPVVRDISRKGIASLWEGPMSNWPGLANYLPAKIDPTTGEVLEKTKSGPGILVGAQQEIESPITVEANRLRKLGHDVTAPKDYPDSVSIGGAEVKLSPDEQRKVTAITGKMLGDFAERLGQPDYQNATEDRKARLMQAYLNAAEKARVSAAREVLGGDELRRRIVAGQQTVGRLNTQASPPAIPFLSSASQSAQEQAAGARR